MGAVHAEHHAHKPLQSFLSTVTTDPGLLRSARVSDDQISIAADLPVRTVAHASAEPPTDMPEHKPSPALPAGMNRHKAHEHEYFKHCQTSTHMQHLGDQHVSIRACRGLTSMAAFFPSSASLTLAGGCLQCLGSKLKN